MVAGAVLTVILAVTIGRAAWKKPNAGARLAALLGVVIGCWVILAVASPSGVGVLAVDAGRGIGALAHGIDYVITHAGHAR